MYQLLFVDEYIESSWVPISFFSEQGTVYFTLHPIDNEEYNKNTIEGGPLNREYKAALDSIQFVLQPLYAICQSEQQTLFESDRYYSKEVNRLYKQLEQAGEYDQDKIHKELNRLFAAELALSPEARALNAKWKSAFATKSAMKMQYAQEHSSLVGFGLLQEEMWDAIHSDESSENQIDQIAQLFYAIYEPKYHDHPFTELMHTMINSTKAIRVGGQYIDFTAQDLLGNMVTLSEQITGKTALILLWSSWCGPCRSYAKKLIPLYETYKEKGFTVVGVARENSVQNAAAAIAKYGTPWLNLVELYDKALAIWLSYGVGNASGGYFLVDEQGTILAIGPSYEKVEQILKEKLN